MRIRFRTPGVVEAASSGLATCGSDSTTPSAPSTPEPTSSAASTPATSSGSTSDGDKRQTVEGYVCEYGNASVRPTIFSCTDRAQGAEFAVDEAS